ncbi:MAG TPA: glucan biosynthesis protein, partial [Clostridia bacterium]|nr:glucan biosynthesis protein [Clostridia bacterium]
ACLFPRKATKKFGLAPLTSMFLMAENRTRFIPDFRPEVHDSDGLLVRTAAGEQLWRPLVNPDKKHQISQFPLDGLRGFGLLQRDRDFHHYEDLGARYELRPSYWVEPLNNWGAGMVELVEIPSPNEYNDNIVAYWVPKEKPAPGQEYRFTFRISALLKVHEPAPLLRVLSTRITPQQDKTPPRFIIDFTGGSQPSLAVQEKLQVQATTQASCGQIQNLVTQKNEVTGGWRVFFDLTDTGREPAEVRVFLGNREKPLSETWVYRHQNP